MTPRATDAALAAAVFACVLAAAVLVEARPDPAAAAVGVAATVAFEAVAGRRERAVRRHWERPAVQAGSLAVAVALVAVGGAVAPRPVLSAAGGALAAYLALLVLVAAGVLAPPGEWW